MLNVTKEEFAEALAIVNAYEGEILSEEEYLNAKIDLCTRFLKKHGAFPERSYVKILKEVDGRPAIWVEVKDATKMSEYIINKDSITIN